MLDPNIFNQVFLFPILNILVLFYQGFLYLHIPAAFGLAIVALTVSIRLLLHPFFHQQVSTAKKMQDLKPKVDELNAKHKDDKVKLQQAQMQLYKDAGVNPAAGCLFLIIQMPIFIGLYNTLSVFLTHGTGPKVIADINKILYFPFMKIQSIDPWLLGFNLTLSPQNSGIWYYYAIPLVTGYLQYLQVSLSTAQSPAPSKGIEVSKSDKNEKPKTDNMADFQKAMNTQMKFIFPVMIAWFSFTLPIGLSLYWNIFSIFSIVQYRQMNKKPAENEKVKIESSKEETTKSKKKLANKS